MGWMRRILGARPRSQRGQAIVELAFTFPVVFAMIVSVLELGFAFNAYTTVVDAARNGARAGAVYLYNPNFSQDANKANREDGVGDLMDPPYLAPYQDNVQATVDRTMAGTLRSGLSYDINITYTPPYPYVPDTGEGDLINVLVVYHYRPLTGVFGNWTIDLKGQSSDRME